MGSRGFSDALKDGRDRLAGIAAADDSYAAVAARRVKRHWRIVVAVVLVGLTIGVAGYAIGSSKVIDADIARQTGTTAGEERGTAVGTREGYASAFKPAREQAYDAAYRDAYRTAYRDAFRQADLDAPDLVEVSGP